MTEWLEIASSIARFSALVISPFLVAVSCVCWSKKDSHGAIYFMAWAILCNQLGAS